MQPSITRAVDRRGIERLLWSKSVGRRSARFVPETVERERLLPGIQIRIYLRGWNCYVTGGPLRRAAEDKGVRSSNGSSFS
jgi:hypothetical protein